MQPLAIDLLESEQGEFNIFRDRLIFSVSMGKAGPQVTVREEWKDMDEIYSDSIRIQIPARVWAIAAPWISARIAEMKIA